MKFSFLILLFLLPGFLPAQDAVPGKQAAGVDSLLSNLYKTNDHVISFCVKFTEKNDERSDYFILAKSGDRFSAYNYTKNAGRLEALNLSRERIDLAWRTFIQNDLFTMQDEKDIPNFCLGKYQIYNSYTYEFVLFSGGRVKTLSYYNPEYYDNACYGVAERAKIINCVSVINYLLNK